MVIHLEIIVSNKSNRPLYEQIAIQIKTAIMNGELKEGDAIPSVRSLAKSLHISVLTVQKAYAILQDDGFMEKDVMYLFKVRIFTLKNNKKKLRIFFSRQ